MLPSLKATGPLHRAAKLGKTAFDEVDFADNGRRNSNQLAVVINNCTKLFETMGRLSAPRGPGHQTPELESKDDSPTPFGGYSRRDGPHFRLPIP